MSGHGILASLHNQLFTEVAWPSKGRVQLQLDGLVLADLGLPVREGLADDADSAPGAPGLVQY